MWGWLSSSKGVSSSSSSWDPLQGSPGTPVLGRDQHLHHPSSSHEPHAFVPSSSSSSVLHPEAVSSPAPVLSSPSSFSTPVSSFSVRAPFSSPPFQTPMRDLSEASDAASSSEFEAFSLLADFKFLARRMPDGMYVLPSAIDAHVWAGWLFVRRGPFAGAVFEFCVEFENYPMKQPSIRMLSRLFHPRVHPVSGMVATLLDTWKPQANRVWHVLQALHQMVLLPAPCGEAALNPDAELMLVSTPETFEQFAKQNAKETALKASSSL